MGGSTDDFMKRYPKLPFHVTIAIISISIIWGYMLAFLFYKTANSVEAASDVLFGKITMCLTPISMYLLVVFVAVNKMSPGYVPSSFDEQGAPTCKKCGSLKPVRTRHCSKCNRCITKMDHHCHFVDQCIGYRNNKVFIQFLVATVFGVGEAICGLLWIVLRSDSNRWTRMVGSLEGVAWGFTWVWIVVLIFTEGGIGYMLVTQLWYLSRNITTLEWIHMVLSNRGKAPKAFCHPYDVGAWSNIKLVMGESPLTWLIPEPVPGDGLSFPVSIDYLKLREILQKREEQRNKKDVEGNKLDPGK